ncbi:MAG: hypothetical protein V4689_02340 [Verrucomicrobiota bacterium]
MESVLSEYQPPGTRDKRGIIRATDGRNGWKADDGWVESMSPANGAGFHGPPVRQQRAKGRDPAG